MRDFLIVVKHYYFYIGMAELIAAPLTLGVGLSMWVNSAFPLMPIRPGLDSPVSENPAFTDGYPLKQGEPITFIYTNAALMVTTKYVVINRECHMRVETRITSADLPIGSDAPCIAEGLMEGQR